MTTDIPCPCGSHQTYSLCCRPLHEGELPDTALQLMRSRYAAYVLHLVDYLIKTTHPASPYFTDNTFGWKRGLLRACQSSQYEKLEILDFKENGAVAAVVFTVHFTREGKPTVYTERSYFERINDRWLYRTGQFAEGREPSLVMTMPLRVLSLAYYNHPVLRRVADPITEITQEIKDFVAAMVETMDADQGAGLAAPQVHRSIRVFVTRVPVKVAEDKYVPGEVRVCINPEIKEMSDELWHGSEGCLSIPGVGDHMLPRPQEIAVEYVNLEGEIVQERLRDLEAKAFQHELDHINGILYIDRLDAETREKLQPFLDKLEKRTSEINYE